MEENEPIPFDFIDILSKTKKIMRDPVKMEDGYNYERESIIKYMDAHSNKSPMSGEVMSRTFTTNKDLKDRITKYLDSKNIFHLILKGINGRHYAISELKPDSKLSDLKKILVELTGTSAKSFKLQFNQKTLNDDNKKLKDFNIINNSCIRFFPIFEGG